MTKHTLRTHAQIFFPVLSVLMGLLPLPSCGIIGKGSSTLETEGPLWGLTNPESSFTVSLKTDSSTHTVRVGDPLELEFRSTEDAYLMVLNWDSAGKLSILLPNAFDRENRIIAHRAYFFPGRPAKFEFSLGHPGVERFKVIAFSPRYYRASAGFIHLFKTELNIGSQSFWRWEDSDIQKTEKRIIDYLDRIDSEEWAEDNIAIGVRE